MRVAPSWFGRLRDRLRGRRAETDALAARAGQDRLAVGEALLAEGRRADAMAELLPVLSREPGLLDHFGGQLDPVARALGGEVWLEYRLVWLRAALEAARAADRRAARDAEVDPDELAELLRESYGELVEEHRGSQEAMDRIRSVGRLIDEATARGELPRALIRRGPRE